MEITYKDKGYAIPPYRVSHMAKLAVKIYDMLTDNKIMMLSASEARVTLNMVLEMLTK